ncbi:MAG TPA: RNA pseudouridine synthase [Opitutaceae bacterium]
MSFWDALPLGPGVAVISRDENGLAALNKPAGVLSIPNGPSDEARSLIRGRYVERGEYFEWEGGKLWLLNRLDSVTSGVILAAASAELAEVIRTQFKKREVEKTYQALVFGRPANRNEVWKDRIAVNKGGGKIRAGEGNIPAESAMKLVRTWSQNRGLPNLALLQLEPHTGRSHQLRVQCARRRLPIVGDQTYGDFAMNRLFAKTTKTKRLMLHSLSTRVEYEFAGKTWQFRAEAALPAEFELAIP